MTSIDISTNTHELAIHQEIDLPGLPFSEAFNSIFATTQKVKDFANKLLVTQLSRLLAPRLYVGAFKAKKTEKAKEKCAELIERYGVERKCVITPCGYRIDGLFFDARKMLPIIESDPSWFDKETLLTLPNHRLSTFGDETVLLCFGASALCELKHNQLISFFLSYGFNVRVFNYPGYGTSSKVDGADVELTPKLLCSAGEAVYRNLREQVGDEARILLYGISLGSCITTHIASTYSDDPISMMLDRGLSKMSLAVSEQLPHMIPNHVIGKLAGTIIGKGVQQWHEYPNDEKIAHYKKGLALLPAEKDEMISEMHMQELAAAYICGSPHSMSAEDLIFKMPGGHGWKIPAWFEMESSEGALIFNEALESLGYITIPN